MKREVRLLQQKAVNALVLAVEHFNRPHDIGRPEAVLILLDHGFEMLLKAGLLHRGGAIRDSGEAHTIGFATCVRRAVSTASVAFLSEEQALTLQSINGLRDAAQHHLLDISEAQLHLHAQAGVTLFADVYQAVFDQSLGGQLTRRVLPVSTELPRDLDFLVDREIDVIRELVKPGRRRRVEASAKLRTLCLMEAATAGETEVDDREVDRTLDLLADGRDWKECFPGIASLQLSTEGEGLAFSIRIVKKEGVPIHLVPEGTAGASVVAVKRVNELDYYSLGRDDVARQCGLSPPRTTAVIRALGLRDDLTYFKSISIGKMRVDRYSNAAVKKIREALVSGLDVEEAWAQHGYKRRARQERGRDVALASDTS